ncbi:MAG: cytochrome P450 [bacterium]|nr:cytochrome P450 [bacterium]
MSRSHAQHPPGPKGLPWFGSLREIRDDPMAFHTHVARDYGGIARFFYGRKPTYLVAEPKLIRELLVDHADNYTKDRRYKAHRDFVGEGILVAEGETWKRLRGALNAGMSRTRIADHVDWMADRIARHLDTWRPHVDSGEPLDIQHGLEDLNQLLIGRWVLGPGSEQAVARVIEIVHRMQANWPKPPKGLFGSWRLPPLGRIRRLKQVLRDINECLYGAIQEQRRTGAENNGMLSLLERARDEQGGFTDREIRDQLATLYFAGFETSAATATFLFYRLSLQPQQRELLYDEVDRVLGGRNPTSEDMDKLEYTERAIREALRLYPPAYNFSRVALEDDSIGGCHIPAGAMVIVSPYATHRLKEHWPNPEGFDPDRFLPEQVAERDPHAFIPFGAGKRMCIGSHLGLAQAKLMVAQVAQRYRLDLLAGHPFERIPGTVMRARFGMPMRVLPV